MTLIHTIHTRRGFTLIELMVVVVIIGILAAFAYPNYTRYVRDTRRTDAHRALSQIAALQEKYYSQCSTYTDKLGGSIGATCGTSGSGLGYSSAATPLSSEGHYEITVTDDNPDDATDDALTLAGAYFISAKAVATGAQKTDGKVGLSHTGAQFWDRDNDGTFGAGDNKWRR